MSKNVDISEEIRGVETIAEGEGVIDSILSAFTKLNNFAKKIDISLEKDTIGHSYYGNAVKKSIGRALMKLASFEETPVIAMGASDYEAMSSHDPETLYCVCKDDCLSIVSGDYLAHGDGNLGHVYVDESSISSIRYAVIKSKQTDCSMSVVFGKDLTSFLDDPQEGTGVQIQATSWYYILFGFHEGMRMCAAYVKHLDLENGCGEIKYEQMKNLLTLETLVIGNNETNVIREDAFKNNKGLKSIRIKMAEGTISGYEYYPWGAPKGCTITWEG